MHRTVARVSWLSLIVLIGGLGLGCKKSIPPVPVPAAQDNLPKLEVSKDRPLLYTYVEPKGTFATTDKPEDVPPNARRLVRVVDPAKATDRRDATRVYVVDLGEMLGAGKATAHVMSREAFETGALAQLPPGESSLLSEPHGPPLPDVPIAGVDGGVGGGPLGPPVVILYGTPWCGACKAAKQYLAAKHIPYAYKDIENDPAAARELQVKAARMGIPTDRVPILDVRGRLLLGFDRARLDAMLGDAT